jgi:hypothetical protein
MSGSGRIEKIRTIHRAHRGVDRAPRIHAELRVADGVGVGREPAAVDASRGLSGLQRRKGGRTTVSAPGVRVADDP